MNFWLHRISYYAEVAHPLLDNNYLSIGFSDFCTQDFIDNVTKNGWDAFEDEFENTWGSRPKSRYSLWHFITGMKKGDWVVVPGWGTFSVYEIQDDSAKPISELDLPEIKDWSGKSLEKKKDGLGLIYTNSEKPTEVDLGFIRKVKEIKKGISRYEYADSALTSRMKIRLTCANISDIKESIEKAIDGFIKEQPLNIYSQIISKTSHHILDTIRTELTPDKFEILIKWYFQRIGASEVYIPSKNESGKEGDADVVAIFEPLKTIIYAQVKFHTGETSSWAIEQITNYKDQKDTMDDGYSKISWVISTADNFSKESYDLAKEAKVQLVDGKQFTKMLLEAGIVSLDKAL